MEKDINPLILEQKTDHEVNEYWKYHEGGDGHK